MLFSFTRVSRNRKTGPIPVVTASKDTCPSTCPLMGNGCYAEHGPLALQWGKCRLTLDELCNRIRRLPKRQLWRYGQAGDLPARTEEIEQLARANGRRSVICYTHHRNFDAIRRANELGFHINISADNLTKPTRSRDRDCPRSWCCHPSTVAVENEVAGQNHSKPIGSAFQNFHARQRAVSK